MYLYVIFLLQIVNQRPDTAASAASSASGIGDMLEATSLGGKETKDKVNDNFFLERLFFIKNVVNQLYYQTSQHQRLSFKWNKIERSLRSLLRSLIAMLLIDSIFIERLGLAPKKCQLMKHSLGFTFLFRFISMVGSQRGRHLIARSAFNATLG